jgi:hypothetical protein
MHDTIRNARRAGDELRGKRRSGIGGTLLAALGGLGLGAVLAHLFDPARGRARRAQYGDQAAAAVRDVARALGRRGRYASSTVRGKIEAAKRLVPTDAAPGAVADAGPAEGAAEPAAQRRRRVAPTGVGQEGARPLG